MELFRFLKLTGKHSQSTHHQTQEFPLIIFGLMLTRNKKSFKIYCKWDFFEKSEFFLCPEYDPCVFRNLIPFSFGQTPAKTCHPGMTNWIQ